MGPEYFLYLGAANIVAAGGLVIVVTKYGDRLYPLVERGVFGLMNRIHKRDPPLIPPSSSRPSDLERASNEYEGRLRLTPTSTDREDRIAEFHEYLNRVVSCDIGNNFSEEGEPGLSMPYLQALRTANKSLFKELGDNPVIAETERRLEVLILNAQNVVGPGVLRTN